MPYEVEIAYPKPMSEIIDELLDQLAARWGGRWTSSGSGMIPALDRRDIEFTFVDADGAKGFAREIQSTSMVQVEKVSQDEKRWVTKEEIAAFIDQTGDGGSNTELRPATTVEGVTET